MGTKSDFEREKSVGASPSGKTGGAAPKVPLAAQELGAKAKQSAGAMVETQFSEQKEKATGGMGHVAEALRKSGEHLREQHQEQIAGLAEKAAEQVERISGYVKSSNLKQLVNEVESLARREPALFLGGAFALGLLGARFLKSSASRDASGLANSSAKRMQRPTFTRSPSPSIGAGGYGTKAGQIGSSTVTPGESFSPARPADWPGRGEH